MDTGKKQLWFLTGASGSGKGHFRDHFLPSDIFYLLRSMTTRKMRDGEIPDEKYFFMDVPTLRKAPKVTYLEITPEWLYAVPESEILNNQDRHLIYDVNQPEYIRQTIDWCQRHHLDYDFKILYFLPKGKDAEIAALMKKRNKGESEHSINTRLKRDTSIESYKRYAVEPDYIINNWDYASFPKALLEDLKELGCHTPALDELLPS